MTQTHSEVLRAMLIFFHLMSNEKNMTFEDQSNNRSDYYFPIRGLLVIIHAKIN